MLVQRAASDRYQHGHDRQCAGTLLRHWQQHHAPFDSWRRGSSGWPAPRRITSASWDQNPFHALWRELFSSPSRPASSLPRLVRQSVSSRRCAKATSFSRLPTNRSPASTTASLPDRRANRSSAIMILRRAERRALTPLRLPAEAKNQDYPPLHLSAISPISSTDDISAVGGANRRSGRCYVSLAEAMAFSESPATRNFPGFRVVSETGRWASSVASSDRCVSVQVGAMMMA